jgi:hypothetical protein
MAKVIFCPVPGQILEDMSQGVVQDVRHGESLLPVVFPILGGTLCHGHGDSLEPDGGHKVVSLWQVGSDCS